MRPAYLYSERFLPNSYTAGRKIKTNPVNLRLVIQKIKMTQASAYKTCCCCCKQAMVILVEDDLL